MANTPHSRCVYVNGVPAKLRIFSGSLGFWSGTGGGIVVEEQGLSFEGMAEEQKNTGNDQE